MDTENRKSTKAELAVALAQGVSAAQWARQSGVTKMTAYRWAKEPEVRKMVEAIRRRRIDLAVGRMNMNTIRAADDIVKISQNAESDSVRLRACRAIFSDMMAVSKYSGLEERMTGIEERLEKRNEASASTTAAKNDLSAAHSVIVAGPTIA